MPNHTKMWYNRIGKVDKMDCLFCKIINGEIPCKKIYEDDEFFVFLDLNQQSEGHALIVPKEHVADYKELSDEKVKKILKLAENISEKLMDILGKTGVSFLFNYGTNQEIKHFHLHIMPNFLKENGTKSIDEVYDILKGKF